MLTRIAACTAFLITVALIARPTSIPPPNPVAAGLTSDAAAQKLQQILPDLTFDDTPLELALATLRERSGTNLVVFWTSLESAGVARTTPISLKLRNVTVSRALQILLSLANASGNAISFDIKENVVQIAGTSSEVLKGSQYLYDINDIVEEHCRPPVQTDPGWSIQAMPRMRTREDATEDVARSIEASIEPESWRDTGRCLGVVKQIPGALLITHTRPTHERIVALLDRLRAQRRELRHDAGGARVNE